MDPLSVLLAPFIPLAVLVASFVALVRALVPRINGKPAVYMLAFIGASLVTLWNQAHAVGSLGGIDWFRVAIELPAVFVIAVGGTAWLQKIQDRGAALPPMDTESLIAASTAIGDAAEKLHGRRFAAGADALNNAAAAVKATVGKPVVVQVNLDGQALAQGVADANSTTQDLSYASLDPDPSFVATLHKVG